MALTFHTTSAPCSHDPGAVAIMRDRSRTVVLLCEGSRTWGAGMEAAAWSLEYLERRWSRARLPEPAVMLEDIAALRAIIPREYSEVTHGCDFDLVLLDCSGREVRSCAVGLYSVVLFDAGYLRNHCEPNTLAAELVKRGELSESEALHHRFRHVGCGPWIMDGALDLKMSEVVVLGPGSSLLVMSVAMAERLEVASLTSALSARRPAAALQSTLGREISLVIVTG